MAILLAVAAALSAGSGVLTGITLAQYRRRARRAQDQTWVG